MDEGQQSGAEVISGHRGRFYDKIKIKKRELFLLRVDVWSLGTEMVVIAAGLQQ